MVRRLTILLQRKINQVVRLGPEWIFVLVKTLNWWVSFVYLGVMLYVEDADAAVEAGVAERWNTFRQLTPLLSNKFVFLLIRG